MLEGHVQEALPLFLLLAGKKYIWQKTSLEGMNLICFFAKKQIKFTPSKKIYLIYYLPDSKSWQKIMFKNFSLHP